MPYVVLIVLVVGLCLTTLGVSAQSADTSNPFATSAYLLGKSYGDSVVLRWGIDRPGAWASYNRIGWRIDRMRLDSGRLPQTWVRVSPEPILPWALDEWKQRTSQTDAYAGAAAQCLYGSLAVPNPDNNDALAIAASDLRNRHGFAHFIADVYPLAATGLALRFVDRTVARDAIYQYRLTPVRWDTVFIPDTATTIIAVSERDTLPPVVDVRSEPRENTVTLLWTVPPSAGITAYHVYRTTNGKTVRLTDLPYVPVANDALGGFTPRFYTDTAAGMYTLHTYRLRAIDAFGDEGKEAAIEAFGRDATPPPPPDVNIPLVYGSTTVRLEWNPTPENADVAAYRVLRSSGHDGPFVAAHDGALSRLSNGWLDTAASFDEPFYRVAIIDTAGNEAQSATAYAELIDTVDPMPPTGLVGFIDSTGRVLLSWNRGSERDIYGYRVLTANDSTHAFAQLANLIHRDTIFLDSIALNTATPYVYYKVVAVDGRQGHSQPSAMLSLRRPDILPPVAPLIADVIVGETTVALAIEPSTSDDVAMHIVERQIGSGPWESLDTLTHPPSAYTDTVGTSRITYAYRLIAVDSSGLWSAPSIPVRGTPSGPRRFHQAYNVVAEYDSTRSSVVIRWMAAEPPSKDYWFVLLRGVDDFGMVMLEAVESTTRTFEDRALVGAGRYRYAVQVMSRTEDVPPSEIIEVVVPR
ncbi:MAG: hypothetical protein MUC47_03285 [Candidatus Kapabacteria bacterium]|nr:hypothetical protein [Candidatus Kapabacteria bacterium]